MADSLATDVCVIGGGPAGASIARRLALLGHEVCLIEKAVFPRQRIGESLPPSILQVLELLDVREQVEQAGFYRPEGSHIRWSSAGEVWKSQPGDLGFQVDRGRFDQLLVNAARSAGVRVFQPAYAGRPQHQGLHQWRVPVRTDHCHSQITAQFLVDATGKHSSLSGKQLRYSPSTLALYGYWHNSSLAGLESRIEAGEEEWYWGAPLPNGTFNAAVFLDAKRYAGIKVDQRERFYCDLLAKTTLLHSCLEGTLATPVKVCDASTYFAPNPIQADWIKVGEAAFSIDPLSSQGVQVAMMSAFQGSIAVHTILNQPENGSAAITFYRDRQNETVQRNHRTAVQFYAEQDIYPATSFWQSRITQEADWNLFIAPLKNRGWGDLTDAEPEQWPLNTSIFELNSRVQLSAAAKLVFTPVIQGDLIQSVKALHHPSLERPIAYLGNLPIAPFLNELVAGQTIVELIQRWSKQQSVAICWQVLQWLWSHHIIVNLSP